MPYSVATRTAIKQRRRAPDHAPRGTGGLWRIPQYPYVLRGHGGPHHTTHGFSV